MSARTARFNSATLICVALTLALVALALGLSGSEVVAQPMPSDVSAAIAKDETPGDLVSWDSGVDNDGDTAIDEDPILDGVDNDGDGGDGEDPASDVVKANEPQLVPVRFTFEAGDVADTLDLTIAIAGPSACDPRWAGSTAQVVTLGPLQYSTLTFATTEFAANDVLTLEEKYSVRCPSGAHHFNIYAHLSSATGTADPNPIDNQAENQLQVIATEDVDGDGVPNAADGCDWTPDSKGADSDGDGFDDACDLDDDGDSMGVTNEGVAVFGDDREVAIGTDPASACTGTPLPDDEDGADAWPPDFNDDQRVGITDILSLRPFLRGDYYSARFDLNANGYADIGDVYTIRDFFMVSCASQ